MVVAVLCMTAYKKQERWPSEKSHNEPCLCSKRAWEKRDRWWPETTEHGEGIDGCFWIENCKAGWVNIYRDLGFRLWLGKYKNPNVRGKTTIRASLLWHLQDQAQYQDQDKAQYKDKAQEKRAGLSLYGVKSSICFLLGLLLPRHSCFPLFPSTALTAPKSLASAKVQCGSWFLGFQCS